MNNFNYNGYNPAMTEGIISFLKSEGDSGLQKMIENDIKITFDESSKENLFNKFALLKFVKIVGLDLPNEIPTTIFQTCLNVEILKMRNAKKEELLLQLLGSSNKLKDSMAKTKELMNIKV